MFAAGEQLRRGVVIKLDHGLPDRHLFERNFFVHEFILPWCRQQSWRLQDKSGASSKPISRAGFYPKFR
jgi:hypothetical protein